MVKITYDKDDDHFNADAYRVKGAGGVAWWVLGWETKPDEDSDWSGLFPRTGKVVVMMVGDDRKFVKNEEDLVPLKREQFCGACGQVGCGHG